MKTVAVYKTNVDDGAKAQKILEKILQHIKDVDPNFDLEDCDKVLRVESLNGGVDEAQIEEIMKNAGVRIEELV